MEIDSRLSNTGQAPPVDTGTHVLLTARAFSRLAEQRLRRLGLGVAHVPVLMALTDEGTMSVKQLAARVRVEQPTATALVQRMQAAGLVERTPDPTDRRSSRIGLTPRGETVLPEALRMRAEAVASATATLSADEVRQLDDLLGRVRAALDEVIAAEPDGAA